MRRKRDARERLNCGPRGRAGHRRRAARSGSTGRRPAQPSGDPDARAPRPRGCDWGGDRAARAARRRGRRARAATSSTSRSPCSRTACFPRPAFARIDAGMRRDAPGRGPRRRRSPTTRRRPTNISGARRRPRGHSRPRPAPPRRRKRGRAARWRGAHRRGPDAEPFPVGRLDPGGGIALFAGSPSSHVAMLARARGVPMVVGLGARRSRRAQLGASSTATRRASCSARRAGSLAATSMRAPRRKRERR